DDSKLRDVFLSQPGRYLPLCGTFTQDVMRGPSPLSVAQRELIAAYVSRLNACRYCAGVHTAVAEDNGVAAGTVEALIDDLNAADVEPKLAPILAYVRKLTEAPHRMGRADYDAVMAAGWDERALGDAIAICALFNFFNRLVEGHGIKGTEEGFAQSTRFLSEFGYESFLREAAEKEASR
ncbi:MAG: carboxymuconolactone decarboxylase family protein, partial [Alphaproteobacteria bacterium]